MFRRVRNFFYNHRRKFLFGGVFFGTLILLARYARGKVRESQEKEVNELLERTRRRQHFENTERTCNEIMQTLSSNLRNAVTKCLDCEKIVNELREGTADKISAWNTLKVLAISRTATIIYSYTMFVITLRIHFNVLGGCMLKDSKISNNSSQSLEKVDERTREKYLSACGYLMDEGIKKLSALIQEKVKEITSIYSLQNKLHLHDVQHIYWAISSTLSAMENEDPVKNLSSYIVDPNLTKNNQSDKPLIKLIDQTLDLMESQEVQELMQNNLRAGLALLTDRISEYFNDNVKSDSAETQASDMFSNLNAATMPMAKIIPILNGQVPENPTSGDLPSDWLERLLLSEELKALGANIYEAFCY
ncbi:peroxisomal biogenesis factor 3 [Phymastichus coffea]|uniref:peroxisomal biogenesis factor 3 n=1 Tax=Phymastichus coffea TaxID=108790 RepID=UPI00273C19F6|nr:peroxisomal biogenesis factor 3 [Phymastichus coffea]XP_058801567.1 peroxisomal biogenesis factor 3 [Phymastichus coffea]